MSDVPTHRRPRREAQHLVGAGLVAHVLEPSPPAVAVEPYADDPATPADEHPSLTPTTAGTRTWDDWVAQHPSHAAYATDHWLGAWAPLPPRPANFARTRESLHQLAFYVLSPARRDVTRKIGLRWTKGGFGTPFFGDDLQVRVEGVHLVVQTAGNIRFDEITTLRRAGNLVARPPQPSDRGEFDAPAMAGLDAPLRVDRAGVAFIDAWFGFGASVLEQLRVDLGASAPSLVQLWPEHFDLAFDAGDEAAGARATFGISPGDDAHDDPYLYVAPWQPVDRTEPFWNDAAFNGASLTLAALAAADDERLAALDFLRRGAALA